MDRESRLKTMEALRAATPEKFKEAVIAAGLDEQEMRALENMRESDELSKRLKGGDSINKLYLADQHPTLSKIANTLHISPDLSFKDTYKLGKLNEEVGKDFTYSDFEAALRKIQKHIE